MLRRRILASAMASVMAIGSVAVVASAEDAAVATAQVKTKADLEAYVKSFDKFREDGIYDYGSISGENFLNAIEYADNVLADDKAGVDDYTTAYAMIEAVYNKLTIYSVEELKSLIDSCTKTYNTNNINNEELGDLIYTADSFSDFFDAYDEAESVLNSSDSRIITDAYEKLEAAKNALNPLASVTKAQFRTALKNYETALQKEFAYDSWRIGTIQGSGEATGWSLWAYDGQTVAYGTVYEHVASLEGAINDAYGELDAIKSVSKTTQDNIVSAYDSCVKATAVLNGFTADDTNRATKANVQSLLNQYHGRLVYDYATTAANDLYDAVLAKAGVITVKQADGDYATKFVDSAEVTNPWYVDDGDFFINNNGGTWTNTKNKLISAEISIKIDSKNGTAVYIELDADGKYATGSVYTDKADVTTGKYKLVSKGATVDLTDYIEVAAAAVTSDTDNHLYNNVIDGDADAAAALAYAGCPIIGQWGAIAGASQEMDGSYLNSSDEIVPTYADLGLAMELAETYLTGKKELMAASDIYYIDTIDAIAADSAKGSSAEWTLVYRYLKYALADKYDASYGTHTKAEVEALIEQCYELAEKTGDAALFTYNHTKLVDARQYALDWVKAANKIKTYKDNVTPAGVGNEVATQIYDYLKGYYDALEKDYNAFKYSFEEIYTYIADVKDMIDSEDVKATDDVMKALEDTAYYLSVVKTLVDSNGVELDDNDAFTSDRFFQGYNRVFTNEGEYDSLKLEDGSSVKIAKSKESGPNASHYNLQKAYEALIAAVEAQKAPTVVVGDLNGDGVADQRDAAIILKKVVDGETIDIAIGDFDGDGYADQRDASAILKFVVNQA